MFRSRFGIPIPDDELHEAPFYRPADDSAEIKYMQARRQQLGGYMPQRKSPRDADEAVPRLDISKNSTKAPTGAKLRPRWCSCGCWRSCCAIRNLASYIVPIVPDEARTFGMEALVPPGRNLFQRRAAL